MQIRLAEPTDLASIASVLRESFLEFKSSYTDEAFAATTPRSEELRRRMDEGPVWVALQDETVVGTVSAVPDGRALYIRSMAVLPRARGHGIGELLLHHVENFAYEWGFKRLFLSTTPFLTSAIRLYERFGFRRSSGGPKDLFGTPLFTMVKQAET